MLCASGFSDVPVTGQKLSVCICVCIALYCFSLLNKLTKRNLQSHSVYKLNRALGYCTVVPHVQNALYFRRKVRAL